MRPWEYNIRKVVPYVPGEQPDKPHMIKLNTNENPYPPAPGVTESLYTFDADRLRLYPDPAAKSLTTALAKYYKLAPEQIFVGVGSDDVLALCFLTFFNGGKPILFPDITYSFYDVWAELFRIPYEVRPLRADFSIDPADYEGDWGGIIFPNPNAPTGVLETPETVEHIIRANRQAVVIVDEAYIDFGGVSVLPLLEKYDNLLIVRTFSKSRSMAGMRIGFALGSEKLISYLSDVKFSFNSYTMNLPALRAGVASIEAEDYFRKTLAKIVATREWTKKELEKLGFTFPDSKSNFIFATHKSIPAQELFAVLKDAGIYVRYFRKPRIDNYLRISIGTEKEMHALIDFLKNYISCQ